MNIETIKENNRAAGQFYFSPDTMRFFKSRVLPTVYGGKYFITRETGPSGVPAFSVREAVDGGAHIKTVGPFNSMTLPQAKAFARKLVQEVKL